MKIFGISVATLIIVAVALIVGTRYGKDIPLLKMAA